MGYQILSKSILLKYKQQCFSLSKTNINILQTTVMSCHHRLTLITIKYTKMVFNKYILKKLQGDEIKVLMINFLQMSI